ncbi:hypothetical protein BGW36DRAFT_429067 [Talaromyces proteolyticus]|uniref:Uncharacterized protein n=1 Tax=Talaromyces proteolyticus TaxID=1131652 RepID=A0AAD4KN03_9EURO|nr:uncharacterized protein BGW36DRAFT_429067 [Talaromyces proteolyticus]KAH8695184.1 hypothetical protein BGW36DRAFT_429067 [Talaromyces proteolyticus]
MSPQLCRLETLPAELLEKIFFHSLEVNLPRASLHIAKILSQPIIYKWLIRLAFSSANNGARADFFTPDFLPALLDFWALSTTDRSRLQTSILECRWSTLSLFRQCQRDYVKHIIRKKCGDLNFSADDQCKLENLDYYLCRPMDFDLAVHGRRGSGDLVLKAKVDSADSNSSRHADLRLAFWFHFGAVQLSEPSPVSYELDVFRLPCAPSPDEPPRIPDKLLQEPWTPEKLEFLTLFSHDAYIDEDNDHERTRRVLRQLIRDRDYATFEKLLGMHIKTRNYSYPQPWPVKTRHFRAALKHAEGPNDSFVRLLYYDRWQTLGDRERDIKDGFMANLNLRPGSMGF